VPALPSRHGHLPGGGTRVVVGSLIVILTLGLGLSPDPVAARDLSPYIASLRNSQLAYESAMRSADIQIRSLERGIKKTRRSVSRARGIVARRRDRLEREKGQLRTVRLAWTGAQAELRVASIAPPALQDLSAALQSAAMAPLPTLAATTAPEALTTSDEDPISGISEELASEAHDYVEQVMAARALVAARGGDVRRQERSVDRARHRVARANRNHRRQVRHLAALGRARRGAIARREGAEAGLGYAIRAMSGYAQRRIAKKTNVRPGVTSSFIWPTRGRLTQGFSGRHDGLDIAGYQGTPIRAAAVGVVSYVGWNPWDLEGRAFMVVVAHPGGFETLYGHTLPRRAVRVGDVVRRGEVIGYMGNTGNSTGTHLHLEMRRNRTILNPLAYM
jgi:murein DD-endopeptidase MepM/ murein hydrolase activator NlpD